MSIDPELTQDVNLADWRAFCLAYYEPIVRALRLFRVAEGDVDELAHGFLLKSAEKRFLDKFQAFRQREAEAGRIASFRKYLYKSLAHAVRDAQRKRTSRSKERGLYPEAIEATPERLLDGDAVYALDILHQALQALRRHCERTGKPHLWVIFEETILADEFRGRRAKTRSELLAEFGRDDPQFLDNSLTTAKRAFRRIVQEIIPRWPDDGPDPSEHFSEWMATLRNSNASQFDLLHVAYRIMPFLGDASQAPSAALVVPQGLGESTAGAVYGAPAAALDDDALNILLSFYLEMPLTRLLDVHDLSPHVPSSSPSRSKGSEPMCLLTLVDPTEAERKALSEIDVVGLLVRLKSFSKQLRRKTNHFVPEEIAEVVYTTVNVHALVGYGATIYSIASTSLASNVRVLLGRPWLDNRLRPLFLSGLAVLERVSSAAPDQ
jgi:hypothetical protein